MEGRSTGLMQCLRFAVTALLCTAYSSGTAMAAEGSAGARPTLAVLPFENDSGAARQQFLADGMTDEIAVALSAVPGLAVVARSPPRSR
jgi:TolB-like protein